MEGEEEWEEQKWTKSPSEGKVRYEILRPVGFYEFDDTNRQFSRVQLGRKPTSNLSISKVAPLPQN